MFGIRSLSFLIPCYNDEKTIEKVLREAVWVAKKISVPFEIIVINDASGDNTASVLSRVARKIPELQVITHKINKGYGTTIKELYYAGKNSWLFTIPGDYQVGAKELLKLAPKAEKSDMVVGLRAIRSDNPSRKRQSKIYNLLLQLFFRMPVHDANSVRLMKRQIMEKISLACSSAFVDAELVLQAKKQGFRISETQIIHRQRSHGTSGGGKIKTIVPTIADMLIFFIKNL